MKSILFSACIITIVGISACSNPNHTNNTTTTDSMGVSATPAASDNVVKKQLDLSASQEVPANTSKGKGTADVSYDKTSHMLTYTINYSGLTGAATMAHIHGTAPKGANAGVKRDLSGFIQKADSGSFTDSVMVDGNAIKEDSLMSGFYYFNIHTAANPGGEIRTQIELQ
ncbi:MAG: CHRD domain-containing protein [Flavitalea sp.]